MQILKSANIFPFTRKYMEYATLRCLLHFEVCTREICEKFVYKHPKTIEYDEN